jgi:predicted RNA-binding protein (virulence factor B family)
MEVLVVQDYEDIQSIKLTIIVADNEKQGRNVKYLNRNIKPLTFGSDRYCRCTLGELARSQVESSRADKSDGLYTYKYLFVCTSILDQ